MNDALDFISKLVINKQFRGHFIDAVFPKDSSGKPQEKMDTTALGNYLSEHAYSFNQDVFDKISKLTYTDLTANKKFDYDLEKMDDHILGTMGIEPSW